ncbi:MAG: deoxyribodipyrimidine photo-lyase [bacterium]
MKRIIHWFRRDFRITDNTALAAAVEAAGADGEVIPVYVMSDWKGTHDWTGAARQEFICDSLASLGKNLEAIGGQLIVRRGDAVAELERLVAQTGAVAIFVNRDPDPFGRATEAGLANLCQAKGVALSLHKDICIHERDEVMTGQGTVFRVFTPYSKVWFGLPKPSPSTAIRRMKTPEEIPSLPVPRLSDWGLIGGPSTPEAGERAARDRLKRFLDAAIGLYGDQRDIPSLAGTSQMSQDLRFGLISPRQIYSAAKKKEAELAPEGRKSVMKFLTEIVWREFYMQLLWHYPELLGQEFNTTWRGLEWPGLEAHPDAFDRWCQGQTGFPIVDAGMRQLTATGWMHNRVRMIVAMFLTKDLHLDWRLGEAFFMRSLIDGEIASNNGGWQWSAGTGADAAPYFRIQNPWSQTKRYDPEGSYIRKWVPELRNVSKASLLDPPVDGRPIAPGYPLPMLHHAEERDRTLDLFALHKASLGV